MTVQISNNPIILASNEATMRQTQKQDGNNFEAYLTGSGEPVKPEKEEVKQAAPIQASSSALSLYMQQLEEIGNSNGQGRIN